MAGHWPSRAELASVLPRLALALVLGGAGGWLAALAGVPLPWLLGSMLATMLAATAGVPVAAWTPLRSLYVAVLGVLLGSGFGPGALGEIASWAVSLGVLAVYSFAAGVLGMLFFMRVARLDPATSFFAAMPGGLSEMVFVGEAMGGDVRAISLTHAARLMLVILVLPLVLQAALGPAAASGGLPGPALAALGPRTIAVLLGCALIGWAAARLLRLPAAPIVGPMILSAGVHMTGMVDAGPPREVVATAQVVVGSAIGARFAGTPPRVIARVMTHAAGGTAVLFASLLGFAALAHVLTGTGLAILILAYAPGGLAEMSLIALALDIQPGFVATHHIVRITLIVLLAPTVYRLLRRLTQGAPAGR